MLKILKNFTKGNKGPTKEQVCKSDQFLCSEGENYHIHMHKYLACSYLFPLLITELTVESKEWYLVHKDG